MDINQVKFGGYSIGSSVPKNDKNDAKTQEALTNTEAKQEKNVSSEGILDALALLGSQYSAQVARHQSEEVNPSDYLSDDRISDIEAMMGEFENGVNQVADIIDEEFPGMFDADKKYALAANIFAQE